MSHPSPAESGRRFRASFRRLADPKIYPLSLASIFLGACAAAAKGDLHPGWLGATVLAIFALEAAKNASGEIVDYGSGADRAVDLAGVRDLMDWSPAPRAADCDAPAGSAIMSWNPENPPLVTEPLA